MSPELLPTRIPSNVPLRRCSVSREKASRRILIFLTGANGDILMSTPLLTGLREAWPDAHITWIAEYSALDAIDANPMLDAVIRYDGAYFRRPLRNGSLLLYAARCVQFCRLLGRQNFTHLLSFEPEQWLLFTLYLRRTARTIGIFDRWKRSRFAAGRRRNVRYFHHVFTASDLPEHRSQQALLPLNALDIPHPPDRRMSMGFEAKDQDDARRFLLENGIGPIDPYIVVAPMTTWESRCWPVDRYARLCDRLHREGCVRVVLVGTAEELPQIESVSRRSSEPHVVAAGAFRFRVLAALIAGARLVISGDTGPLHVAGAVGTPYLAFFGPTPVLGRTPLAGPGRGLMHPLPCAPCDCMKCPNPPETFMRCMDLITVDEAFDAATELLKAPAPPPARPLATDFRRSLADSTDSGPVLH